jgi:hypothetical protein
MSKLDMTLKPLSIYLHAFWIFIVKVLYMKIKK